LNTPKRTEDVAAKEQRAAARPPEHQRPGAPQPLQHARDFYIRRRCQLRRQRVCVVPAQLDGQAAKDLACGPDWLLIWIKDDLSICS